MIRKRLTTGIVIAVLIVSVGGVGTVTTGVLAEESDDDDSRETATEMPTNSTETGALGANDVDWYAFDVEAGERVWVHLQLGSNDGTLKSNKSVHFDIVGPSGDEVNRYPDDMMGPAYSPNAGNNVEAVGGTMATESGTHYVRVEGRISPIIISQSRLSGSMNTTRTSSQQRQPRSSRMRRSSR